MTTPDKLIERVAKALFELEQRSPFSPKLTNMTLYGQHPVTWDFINSEQFVSSCSDHYRRQAAAAIEAVKSYKQSEIHCTACSDAGEYCDFHRTAYAPYNQSKTSEGK